MVEGTGLLIRRTRILRTEGSNPFLSAIFPHQLMGKMAIFSPLNTYADSSSRRRYFRTDACLPSFP